ncbi:MAG TPA: DUF4899 domain-containing protein [Spirochaetota bacterium]|nr:DUF4899 domain-containing protein [Spirochaetota bacterium]HOM38085.1 DUF4899 domain-containing protein [Spirochaetota bacterium]HPQ48887.1 DUF4899 domain-containing protein [Spirochaetota bacterium]
MNDREKIIIEISTNMDCPPEIVELLYDFTNGDPDGIKKILSSLSKSILLIKANFESKIIDKRGFLYIAYDINNSKIVEKGIFAYKNFQPLNLSMNWEETKKIIMQHKSDNKFDGKMWAFFDKEVSSDLLIKELKRIIPIYSESETKFKTLVVTLLSKVLAPVFYNKNFSLDTSIEFIDPFVFFKPLESSYREEKEDVKKEEKKEDEIFTIKVVPVLDPINGKNVSDLTVNDRVVFELKDEREAANYIGELLQKDNVGLIGKVESYSIVDEDTVRLNIKFAPGISGEALVSKTVLLKTFSEYDEMNSKETKQDALKINYSSFLKLIFIIILVILLLLYFK